METGQTSIQMMAWIIGNTFDIKKYKKSSNIVSLFVGMDKLLHLFACATLN
jgi:hypothetical protein